MNKHTKHQKQHSKKVTVAEMTGIIRINSRGFGYVDIPSSQEDIEVPPELLNTALHLDTVTVVPRPKRRVGRIRGEVVEVVTRAKTRFVGTLEEEGGFVFFKPDDKRCYIDFIIESGSEEIPQGQKVAVEMTRWTTPKKNPLARIVEVLGPVGTHETEMHSIVAEQGFNWHFPPAVEKEADEIEKNNESFFATEVAKRKDFRGTRTFTIDPADAKDFDDAISVRTLENGTIEIGVHIADVSAYLLRNTAMDKEAQQRATSVYLVDRTIPMLPEVLSNNLCSLIPHQDRLAFSAVFIMTSEGEVLEHWFGETVIHSDRRFSYQEAQEILTNGQGELYDELLIADTIARALRAERFLNGSIGFETDEIKFELDETGKPIRAFRKERLDTMKMIEDLMLLANREVATWMARQNKDKKNVFVWRIHDSPKVDRIEELSLFLKALGYSLPHTKGLVEAKDLNALFKEIEGSPEQEMIETATIRSMAKAIYATKNIGHFGLAFTHYTHFTSPIRRYPDVMVHRLVKSQLAGKPEKGAQAFALYDKLCAISSEREVAAMEAERDSVKLKQVEYLAQHIGEEFEGVITGITDWGLFVEETETMAEGLVRTRSLRDDFYELADHGFRLVGSKSKKTLSLGDKVKVRLLSADIEQKSIDWELL
jgi:ribonuclease R